MKTILYSYLFVAFGGALGAVARFSLNLLLQRDVDFPWGTLAANLIGCFLIGILAHLVANSNWFNAIGLIPDQYRLLFAVGFCGSFTTLSTLVLELHTMFEKSEYFAAAAYLSVSVVGGYLLFFAALLLMRGLLAPAA
ncbi:MAG: CrcB family protein [Pseudomonadota bacterium]